MSAVTSRIFRTPVRNTVAVPQPTAEELQVRVYAVGMNPADVKLSALAPSGRMCGLEWAGVVERVGTGVTSYKRGDRVAGLALGGHETRTAAFAEWLCVKAESVFRVPDGVSMAAAASLGVGLATAVLTLRQYLGYPDVNGGKGKGALADYDGPLLIWSGATAFGMHALQLAKTLAPNRKVIVTASKRNHAVLRSLGADYCFDYNDANVTESVRAAVDGPIRAAIDTFGEKATTEAAAKCLTGAPSAQAYVISSLPSMPFAAPRLPAHVVADHVMSYTSSGRAVRVAFLFRYPASRDDYEENNAMMAKVHDWLVAGTLKPMPRKELQQTSKEADLSPSDALQALVQHALPLISSGAMRGEKLVVALRHE